MKLIDGVGSWHESKCHWIILPLKTVTILIALQQKSSENANLHLLYP